MSNQYTTPNLAIRFWSKVSISADDNKCWEWQGWKDKNGYGAFKYKNKAWTAHRIAWMLPNYIIPKRMEVCHSCDNPSCVNPKHLFIGTHQDNMDDRERKGRNKPPKGEAHGCHKLTKEQVEYIRQRYVVGGVSQRFLAREYRVQQSTIWRIIHNLIWRD